MRAILLLAIVGLLCVIALVKPKVGVYAYTWFALMRPDYMAWAVGTYPYSQMLAFATLVGAVVFLIPRLHVIFTTPISLGLLGLQIFYVLSIIFSIDPSLCVEPFEFYMRVLMMSLLILPVVETLDDLKWLILLVAFSVGALGFKFGFGGLKYGGARFSGGYGGFLSDNNDLALAFAMAVPLCWYSVALVSRLWVKIFFASLGMGSLMGVVWTHSRGGFLAVACASLLIALRSRHKVLVLVLLVAMLAPALYLVSETYFSRLATIAAPTQESSAASRLEMIQVALKVWRQHPLLGVGFGSKAFQKASVQLGARGSVAHNTYMQILADSGIMALIWYLFLLFGTIWWLGRSAKQTKLTHPGLQVYPLALQTSLITFAVGSAFLSRVVVDTMHVVLIAAAAWQNVVRTLPVVAAQSAAVAAPVQMPPAPVVEDPLPQRRRPRMRYGDR